MPRVLIIVPAWNEEQTVAGVVDDIQAHIDGADVLVVDDGSRDATAANARAAGARVASLPLNCGLGAALQTGYRYAERHGYDIAGHMDADGQHPAREMARLVAEVRDRGADLAIGSRFLDVAATEAHDGEEVYAPSTMRRLGIAFFRRLLTSAAGQDFTDPTSGFRAASPRVIRIFAEQYGHDYPELESITRLVRAGAVVREIPVVMTERKAGESTITSVRSVYWAFNGVVSLLAARLRPRATLEDAS